MGYEKTILTEGTGDAVVKGKTVTVHCTGYVVESGKKFWSTHDKNEPFSFKIGMKQVIPAWDEGVLTMKIGETSEIVATHDYAYGERGFPAWGIPPRATLKFEIEVLSQA